MSTPRPAFLVLLGAAVLAIAIFTVTRSSGDNNNASQPESSSSKGVDKSKSGSTGSPAQKSEPSTKTPAPKTSSSTKVQVPKSTDQSGATPLSVPPSVAGALVKHKVVVVLFWSRKDSEDRKVKSAVDRLRGNVSKSKVAIFTDSPKRVASYSLVANGVSQSPALVVIDRARKARIVQGYVDYASILQMVREARRVKPG